jgi:thiol-disulfide isomerase/thioredoxin
MKKTFLLLILIFISCNIEKPTQFTEEVYKEMLIGLDDSKRTLREVLYYNKGGKILIDVWASWCKDCIVGIPKIKELQKEFPDVIFLFLSVDRSTTSWKKAITKYNLTGEHYNLPEGMKDGKFVDFINLNWIPSYMVIDEEGEISLFKATNISDKSIKEALKEIK